MRMAILFLLAGVASTAAAQTDAQYIQKLAKEQGHRLVYKNAEGRQIVESFDIECDAKDGRYLPLENLLLARLVKSDDDRRGVVTQIESRDKHVRVIDFFESPAGRRIEAPVLEITARDQLVLRGMTGRVIEQACSGPYGPIWMRD